MNDREIIQEFMEKVDELATHYDFEILKSNFSFKFGMKLYDVIKNQEEYYMN